MVMQIPSFQELLALIFGPFGAIVLSLAIIYTGSRKIWVFGWYAKELEERNKNLENQVVELSRATRRATSLTERAVLKAETEQEEVGSSGG